jgi:arginine exporter protein ArgO
VAVVRGAGLVLDVHAAPAFALGVAVGPILWFWTLLNILNKHMGRFGPEIVRIVEKLLPIVLLAIAGVMLAQALIPLLR